MRAYTPILAGLAMLAACGEPAQPPKLPSLPAGQNTLDTLLKKAVALPVQPPAAPTRLVPLPEPEIPQPLVMPGRAQESLVFVRSRQGGGLTVSAGAEGALRTDPDYQAAGLGRVVGTLPVDRSRALTADRVIPAILENTLDSQFPGRAVAVVSHDVYGADGSRVLIPVGSRIVGHAEAAGKYGQARLEIQWERILRPDGASLNIDAAAADVMGRSGVAGEVDDRFLQKYGASLLVTAISTAGVALLGGRSATVTGYGGRIETADSRARAGDLLGRDLTALAKRIVSETADIRPVITVPQGTRLAVIPAIDLWLADPLHLVAATPPVRKTAADRLVNLTKAMGAAWRGQEDAP